VTNTQFHSVGLNGGCFKSLLIWLYINLKPTYILLRLPS